MPKDYDLIRRNLEITYSKNALVRLLEMKIVSCNEEGLIMSMPIVDTKHTNVHGTAHGGAICSLADTAMGMSCFAFGEKVVTVDMNINLIHNVLPGRTVFAKARVLHHGKNTMVVESAIVDDREKRVAQSRGTFFIVGKYLLEGSEEDAGNSNSGT